MYMILKFSDSLQTMLGHYKGQEKKRSEETSAKKKTVKSEQEWSEEFDETITKWINVQEHKLGKNNCLASLVVNSDLSTSYIVTAP